MSGVQTDAADRRHDPRPQRVLVADDNVELRQLWRAYLTLAGFAVSEAGNGADAVVKAVLDAPVVILMDFSMPGMDGATAARALKSDPRTFATPVIGLTAHGSAAGAHAFHEVCDIVLEKPVSPEAVLDALRRALRRDDPGAPPTV
jgi:CheY-like chemotaxis protein